MTNGGTHILPSEKCTEGVAAYKMPPYEDVGRGRPDESGNYKNLGVKDSQNARN